MGKLGLCNGQLPSGANNRYLSKTRIHSYDYLKDGLLIVSFLWSLHCIGHSQVSSKSNTCFYISILLTHFDFPLPHAILVDYWSQAYKKGPGLLTLALAVADLHVTTYNAVAPARFKKFIKLHFKNFILLFNFLTRPLLAPPNDDLGQDRCCQ